LEVGAREGACKPWWTRRRWGISFIVSLADLAGRAVKARLVDSKRAASTCYSYQNEKQQAERQRSEPLSVFILE